ncbi:type II toxin-antitoxin system RelE/ParE family toxin (plasmid) [Sulfitobacter faviae]|uniref:type II toxin-antitoxin system RelE/ParE family toxin n=1 Tax=Sulfitobacter faviae TaxID=1775881 RepID=UPI002307081D|nr:type II toxin-antitoxin system RelE/ParE family toxin [Sulfitobacter faviae]WCE68609.1 type II toxin-antitoxin system RelE/ParE family toxin [Sulfitobacter faviae]
MPENSRWIIRSAAEADLSDIWHYSAANWGIEQADRYADGLFSLFDLLFDFTKMARERDEFSPPVRIHPSGLHLVIYRIDGQGIEIIRILHAHQNLTAYLLDD